MSITPQTNTNLATLAEVLKTCDDFVVCGHINPDGDCIGSQLALATALRALGKRVTCIRDKDEFPDGSLGFLPGFQDIVPAASFKDKVRTFVAVDVPLRSRLGKSAADLCASADFSVTIDHHASNEPFTDLTYTDMDAASTTVLIWELSGLLGVDRRGALALCCYTGLVTDTGRFQFQNTNADALHAACEMVEANVDPAFVSCALFQNRSLPSLRLEALALSRIHTGPAGTYALSWISRDDFKTCGATKSDAEPIVDSVRSLAGIRVACMLREQDGCVRGSIRAKDNTDVSLFAQAFGGGGHKAAAGFTLDLPLDEALALVEEKIADLCANTCIEPVS